LLDLCGGCGRLCCLRQWRGRCRRLWFGCLCDRKRWPRRTRERGYYRPTSLR
jgi:hypothetical protein